MEERGGTKSQTCSQVTISSLPFPAHSARLQRPISLTPGAVWPWDVLEPRVGLPPSSTCPLAAKKSNSLALGLLALGRLRPLGSGTAGAGSASNCGVGAGFVQHLPDSRPPGFLVVSFQINAPGGSHLSGDFKCARGGPKQTPKKKQTKKKTGFPVT